MFFKDKRKKNCDINLSKEELSAFNVAKEKLGNVSNLTFPYHKTVSLAGDALSFAIGGVLQQCESDEWLPMSVFSKKLSETVTQYSTFRQELMAVY